MCLPLRPEGQPQPVGRRACALACAFACALAGGAAHAQLISSGVALTSEYSARGVSLSAGRPALQASLVADTSSGWYAGAFASSVVLRESAANTQLVAYGGYAHRLASGLSLEAGATRSTFLHGSEYNYGEAYVGAASDHLNARLYFAPHYYGYGGRTAYAEMNGSYPLSDQFRLVGHIGGLHKFSSGRDRVDLRLAVGTQLGPCNVQLAWLASGTLGSGADRGEVGAPRALALSVALDF